MAALVRQNEKSKALRGYLERCGPRFEQLLPQAIPAARLISIVVGEASMTPKLLACSTASIANCCLKDAELGLVHSGVTGDCYLVPYGTTATFILG